MENVLFLACIEPDGSLGKTARETLTVARQAAAELGAEFCAGLIGEHCEPGSRTAAAAGCAALYLVEGSAFGISRYATDSAAAEAIARAARPTLVFAPAVSRVSRFIAGLAQRLGGRVDTQITGLAVHDGQLVVDRWFYRQRIEATLTRTTRPWLLTVAPGTMPAFDGDAAPTRVERIAVDLPESLQRTRVEGVQAPPGAGQTVRPDAELLFVAGAGWTKPQRDGQSHVEQAAQLILGFLDRTQASLGGSKSLVDVGGEGQPVLPFLTHLNQVGQTGATPRHPKGLATCCHGEEPHVVGWRFINERRAINLDPNCGWARGKADVLYVADAFAVMRKVNELLGG